MAWPSYSIEIGFNANFNATEASVTWTDVTQYVWEFSYSRGRQSELDAWDTGRGTVVLNNADGRFSPGNRSSPYYPNVRPMRRLRVKALHNAISYDLCYLFVERWRPGRSPDSIPLMVAEGIDFMAACALEDVAGVNNEDWITSEQDSGARISAALNFVRSTVPRDVDTGISLVIEGTVAADTKVLQHIEDVQLVEDGGHWVRGDGTVVFRNRHARYIDSRSTLQQGAFGDWLSTRQAVLLDQPVLYMRLGEAAGSSQVEDASGYQYTATPSAGVTLGVAGPLVGDQDTAASFNGSGDLTARHNSGPANITTGDFTVAAWIKVAAASTGKRWIFCNGRPGFALRGYGMLIDASHNLSLWLDSDAALETYIAGGAALNDDAWHHVAVSVDRDGNAIGYVDGSQAWTSTSHQVHSTTLEYVAAADGMRIGSALGGDFFSGSLDEIAVFGSALSAARVLAHYNAGLRLTHPLATSAIEGAFDSQEIVNLVKVTRTGGVTQVKADSASAAEFGPRVSTRESDLYKNDNRTADHAAWILQRQKGVRERVRQLELRGGDESLWPAILGLEIGDRIAISLQQASAGLDKDFWVEAFEHRVAANQRASHEVSYRISEVDTTKWLQLGRGRIGDSLIGY